MDPANLARVVYRPGTCSRGQVRIQSRDAPVDSPKVNGLGGKRRRRTVQRGTGRPSPCATSRPKALCMRGTVQHRCRGRTRHRRTARGAVVCGVVHRGAAATDMDRVAGRAAEAQRRLRATGRCAGVEDIARTGGASCGLALHHGCVDRWRCGVSRVPSGVPPLARWCVRGSRNPDEAGRSGCHA